MCSWYVFPPAFCVLERTFEIPCLNNTTLRNLFQELFRTFVLKRVVLFALLLYIHMTNGNLTRFLGFVPDVGHLFIWRV
nr:MAG TPA: hypothetical protein [Caudoviricetes sp.]